MAEQVTVACKLPTGIHLDFIPTEALKARAKLPEAERAMHPLPEARRVTLKGGLHAGHVLGYGMTQVDKDFWDAWAAQNADNPLVKNGQIWALPKEADAGTKAKEYDGDVRSGLEPMAQEGDARAKGLNVKPRDDK